MSARALVLGWLVRAALLLFWSLVLWGGLLLVLAVATAARDGSLLALSRLLPARGASTWAWLNGLSVALALAVGVLAGGYLPWTRRGRAAPPSP